MKLPPAIFHLTASKWFLPIPHSGQSQFRELQNIGLHHIQDPLQMIFMGKLSVIMNAVLAGEIDVAYVRTDQLEITIDPATGELLDLSKIRVINPKEGLQTRGGLFPFAVSTELYPEWTFGALPHVPESVREAVQSSLMELDEHASFAPYFTNCIVQNGCEADPESCYDICSNAIPANVAADCETSIELALSASKAAAAGNYKGWSASESHMGVRNMQEEVGAIRFDPETNSVRCNRGTELADAVVCPEGHFKKSSTAIDSGCADMGLTCYGYSCICKPCVKAYDVNFAPYKSERGQDKTPIPQESTSGETGCEKFAYCGVVEQEGKIIFRAIDNKKRLNTIFYAHVLTGSEEEEYLMYQVDGFVYEFEFDASERRAGTLIVEVFADAEPIPESPFRFEITPRNCALDTNDDLREPNSKGKCVCGSLSVELFGECVALKLLIPCIIGPCLIVLVILMVFYVEYKKRQSDTIWKVDPAEITFDLPPVCLGEGSFGIVLLGNYRGTTVAVKKILSRDTSAGFLRSSTDGSHDVEEAPSNRYGMSSKSSRVRSSDNIGLQPGLYSSVDLMNPRKYGQEQEQVDRSSGRSKGLTRRFMSTSRSQQRQEFTKEMRHLSQLRHPCITTVMGAVVTRNSDPMLVLEYMELGSLYDVIHNGSIVLEGGIVFPIIRDIISGLQYLHSATPPVVHSDLKSKNILVDAQFRAKVSDFGLSSHLGSTSGKVRGTVSIIKGGQLV
eukprot:scaffold1341_cov178-Amphora_coffeaeformis.AAC.20